MNHDERIGFLLRAAARAERDGNHRVAGVLRRMAEDARPLQALDGNLETSGVVPA